MWNSFKTSKLKVSIVDALSGDRNFFRDQKVLKFEKFIGSENIFNPINYVIESVLLT